MILWKGGMTILVRAVAVWRSKMRREAWGISVLFREHYEMR